LRHLLLFSQRQRATVSITAAARAILYGHLTHAQSLAQNLILTSHHLTCHRLPKSLNFLKSLLTIFRLMERLAHLEYIHLQDPSDGCAALALVKLGSWIIPAAGMSDLNAEIRFGAVERIVMYWHQTSADPTHVRTLQKPGHVAARPLYHVDLLQLLDAVFLKRTLRGKKEDAHLYRQANALLMMYGVWRMSCGSSRSKALRVLMIAHKDIVRASSQGEREVSDQSKVRNIVGRSGRDTQASSINP
jgi:hypothetical protein